MVMKPLGMIYQREEAKTKADAKERRHLVWYSKGNNVRKPWDGTTVGKTNWWLKEQKQDRKKRREAVSTWAVS